MNEGWIVESRIDHDVSDIKFLVSKGLGSSANIVLAQTNLQDVSYVVDKWQAGIIK